MAVDLGQLQKHHIGESRNCVFLVGAGSSTEFGPPVMNRFMEVAIRNYFDRKRSHGAEDLLVKSHNQMIEFRQACRYESGWAFNRNWENIEEIYTQADLLRLAELPDKQQAEDLCRDIAWSIWDVYRNCGTINQFNYVIAKVFDAKLKPVFITTNYDFLLEKSLPRTAGFSFYYPGFEHPVGQEILFATNPKPPTDATAFPIIKLHGSANWFAWEIHWFACTLVGQEGQPTSLLQRNDFQLAGLMSTVKPQMDPHGCKLSSENSVPVPAIVPPMLGKMAIAPVIAIQWRAAIEALANARYIVIIGYSFPETDAFMRRLLAEGIKHNADLKRLTVFDIQQFDFWEDRINAIFTPSFRSSHFAFRPVAASYVIELMKNNPMANWGL